MNERMDWWRTDFNITTFQPIYSTTKQSEGQMHELVPAEIILELYNCEFAMLISNKLINNESFDLMNSIKTLIKKMLSCMWMRVSVSSDIHPSIRVFYQLPPLMLPTEARPTLHFINTSHAALCLSHLLNH